MITVENLSYRYADGKTALTDVSFHIQRGEKVGIVGPNGAGKSTLLLLLNGVLRTPQGRILIDGQHLTDQTLGRIRALVGLVFQNPDDQLFSTTVYEDVAFGAVHMGLPEDEVRRRVADALGRVGMQHAATRISYHLSGGEKKRVALATVLTMQPAILALDEPSAGLDPRGRRDLITLLRAFQAETLLISTHDMRLAYQLCTRIVILDDGLIAADGAAEHLLTDATLMEKHGLETINAL
jgi:cobalt transport protein ATP-binding subunit